MEGAMRKSRNGGSSKKWQQNAGSREKIRNGKSNEEEQEWREQ
jgi:hypothetical protein